MIGLKNNFLDVIKRDKYCFELLLKQIQFSDWRQEWFNTMVIRVRFKEKIKEDDVFWNIENLSVLAIRICSWSFYNLRESKSNWLWLASTPNRNTSITSNVFVILSIQRILFFLIASERNLSVPPNLINLCARVLMF